MNEQKGDGRKINRKKKGVIKKIKKMRKEEKKEDLDEIQVEKNDTNKDDLATRTYRLLYCLMRSDGESDARKIMDMGGIYVHGRRRGRPKMR